MDRQEAIDRIRQAANRQHETAVDKIGEFKDKLDVNPVYAFEWGDYQCFMAAAEIEEAARVLNGIKAIEDPEREFDLSDLLEAMKKSASQDFLYQIGGSTGQSHNLMDRAKVVLAGNWFKDDGVMSSSCLVRTVRHACIRFAEAEFERNKV